MAFTENFSATQTVGEPSVVTITDTSVGTDVAIVSRRVYLLNSLGTYEVPSGTTTNYVDFPITALIGDVLDIDCLSKDKALSITVQWLNVSGVVLYTKTSLVGFTLYNEQSYYDLTTNQAADPSILLDTNYYQNKSLFRTYIDSGDQAVSLGNDILSAQLCYDKATFLRLNESKFF